MYHPYGRHGPRAWLRWYRNKYRRFLPTLAPSSTLEASVLLVHIKLVEERTIIIMASPEPQGSSYQEPKNLQLLGRRIPQSLPSDILEELQKALGSYARLDARERAKQDIKVVLQQETDLPSRQTITADAETIAYQHIKRLTVDAGWIVDDDNNTDQLLATYLTNFTEVYDKVLAEQERAGILQDEATRRICQQAKQDKQEHAAQNRVIQYEKLRYFATARAMRALGLDPLLSLDDLDPVEKYVSSYTRFYNQHDPAKGVGRTSQPGSFSGEPR